MSELINNSKFRKEKLKELILKLHQGENPQKVRAELIETLQQIPYGEVVEVEQELIDQIDESGTKYVTACPDWFKAENVVNSIDIREMLNRDEQPVHEVLSAIKKLGDNEILEIIAPFVPAPLLDKSLSLG
jgi:DUF438 domain-containing protein